MMIVQMSFDWIQSLFHEERLPCKSVGFLYQKKRGKALGNRINYGGATGNLENWPTTCTLFADSEELFGKSKKMMKNSERWKNRRKEREIIDHFVRDVKKSKWNLANTYLMFNSTCHHCCFTDRRQSVFWSFHYSLLDELAICQLKHQWP